MLTEQGSLLCRAQDFNGKFALEEPDIFVGMSMYQRLETGAYGFLKVSYICRRLLACVVKARI